MTDQSAVPGDLAAAIAAAPPALAPDKLAVLRALCEEYCDLRAEIADLNVRLGAAKSRLDALRTKTLPEKMDEAGVSAIELAARGNRAAARVALRPFASANVAASWPEERRAAAFDYLAEVGAADLIKTTLTVEFNREDRERALEVARWLSTDLKLSVAVASAVSSQTLSKWLRERVRRKLDTKLDKIGGYVGRVAVTERGS